MQNFKIFTKEDFTVINQKDKKSGFTGEIIHIIDNITHNKLVLKKYIPLDKLDTLIIEKWIIKEIIFLKKINKINEDVAVLLYGVYIDDTNFYLVLEHMCETLEDILTKYDNTSINHKSVIFKQIFLECFNKIHILHCNGILHNDITFANIMINDDNIIKFIDFGISEFIGYGQLFDITDNHYTSNYIRPPDCNELAKYYKKDSFIYLETNRKSYVTDIFSIGIIILNSIFKSPNENTKFLFFGDILYWELRFWEPIDNFENILNSYSIHLLDLLKCIICIDSKKRYNSKQVLDHPYFKDCNIRVDKDKYSNNIDISSKNIGVSEKTMHVLSKKIDVSIKNINNTNIKNIDNTSKNRYDSTVNNTILQNSYDININNNPIKNNTPQNNTNLKNKKLKYTTFMDIKNTDTLLDKLISDYYKYNNEELNISLYELAYIEEIHNNYINNKIKKKSLLNNNDTIIFHKNCEMALQNKNISIDSLFNTIINLKYNNTNNQLLSIFWFSNFFNFKVDNFKTFDKNNDYNIVDFINENKHIFTYIPIMIHVQYIIIKLQELNIDTSILKSLELFILKDILKIIIFHYDKSYLVWDIVKISSFRFFIKNNLEIDILKNNLNIDVDLDNRLLEKIVCIIHFDPFLDFLFDIFNDVLDEEN